MARENQDLQIALIISVMLTIMLGVATFICYRQYTDTAKSLQAAQADGNKRKDEADKARNDAIQLKRCLGVAETEGIENISLQFNEDMKKYGGTYPQEAQFYRPLVEKLFQALKDKDKELADTKDESQKLQNKYVLREKSKDAQFKLFDDMVNSVKQDLQTQTDKFQKDREELTKEAGAIKDQLQNAQKEAATLYTKIAEQLKDSDAQLKKTRLLAGSLREENAKLTNPVMDNPDGTVRWVNQRNGTVWIDVGRGDNLPTLTTFAVYPAEITNMGEGAKKADIEVTQILGDHLAEARILEDKIPNPIMPGDKIHTPIWSPGDKRHFALAGFMDIDGDGKNNMQLLRNLINMNGGVVDSSVDENGKQVGDMTIQTRYVVLGDNPEEKGDTKGSEVFSKMKVDAQNLGIQKISLKELLDRMGYKPQAHVVSFGPGANPNDFKPKAEGGVNRVSTGNVSDVFKRREPPRTGSGGAY
jgi:hypothetical protein